jgi:hypothetical protein
MRRKLALLASTALAGGMWIAPALADVSVTVTVDKQKTITVSEEITINKDVSITVTDIVTLEGFAEAEAVVNATVQNNTVDLQLGGDVNGDFNKRWATIDDSINDNIGVIIGLNQDVGDNANQGNVVSAALTDIGTDPDQSALAHAQSAVDQKNSDNDVFMIGTLPGSPGNRPVPPATVRFDWHVLASITDSIDGNLGVIQVNQNAGNNPNQHNVLSLAVGVDAGVALGEGDLGQENSGNKVSDYNTYKSAQIDGSVTGNIGIVSVNQNAGHNNNQAAVITIAATVASTNLLPSP